MDGRDDAMQSTDTVFTRLLSVVRKSEPADLTRRTLKHHKLT